MSARYKDRLLCSYQVYGILLQALMTPGVFSSGHYIPYIFMSWSQIAGSLRPTLCPDLDGLIDLLQGKGYSAKDSQTLGILPDICLQNTVKSVVWVHQGARPLTEQEFVVDCKFYEVIVPVYQLNILD